jgi:CheY-like chemotaxis protein
MDLIAEPAEHRAQEHAEIVIVVDDQNTAEIQHGGGVPRCAGADALVTFPAMAGQADKKRLLIVDDDEDIRRVAQLSLERIGGFRVLEAETGEAALAMAKAPSDRPDAILLDVMIPDMDGPAMLERLKREDSTRDIPVIFLTAKTQRQDLDRYRALGAAGVIKKPFDPMSIARELKALLGWRD